MSMRPARGFTLVEMTVVIALIGILASMLFPVFARAREVARKAQCASTVAELGLALQMYAADWGGRYPPAEDNLAPVAARVGTDALFRCPSARFSGLTRAEEAVLAKAKQRWYLPSVAGERPAQASFPTAVVVAGNRLLGSSYYYHAGLTTESPASAVLVTEREAAHMGRANVLYASGRVTSVPEAEWRGLIPPAAMRSEKDYDQQDNLPRYGPSRPQSQPRPQERRDGG